MEKKYKYILKLGVPIVIVLALVGVGGFYLGTTTVTTSPLEASIFSPLHVAFVCVSPVRHPGDPDSVLSQYADCSHNVYTRQGMNMTRDYLFRPGAGLQGINVTSLGVTGNGTAPGQTGTDRCIANGTLGAAGSGCNDYTNNGLQPAVGSVFDVVGGPSDFGNISISKVFTCTQCTNTGINATGLYNSTTVTAGGANSTSVGGLSLFAEANFTSATLQTNDQINVTWFVWTQ
ncbi:MAG TPA: hypothetical protein VJJ76_03285 [archaeon]|nr:hypothetical protein [archaeon]